jgi:hypothetical protein
MTFEASFAVDAEHEAYFKVVPSPRNPAFNNGTAASGWWTVATLIADAVPLASGASNGTSVVALAPVGPGKTYTLRLDVRVPPGALVHVGEHRLRYVVALQASSEDGGSGGQMDPSLSVNPRIVVSEAAANEVQAPADGGSMPIHVVLFGLVGAGAVGGAFVVLRRK